MGCSKEKIEVTGEVGSWHLLTVACAHAENGEGCGLPVWLLGTIQLRATGDAYFRIEDPGGHLGVITHHRPQLPSINVALE